MLEGGAAALALSSGTSAIYYAIINMMKAGDEFVSASNLYGGTYTLLHYTFKRLGITVKFVKSNDLQGFRKAITGKTKADIIVVPVVTLVLAAVVGVVILSVLAPIYDLTNVVG